MTTQSDCGCNPAFQQPKPNGTCATCGGWLPGERPQPLPWTQPNPVDRAIGSGDLALAKSLIELREQDAP